MNKPIEIEFSKTGNHLYIFFGGISAGLGMPIFEFYNSSNVIDEHKIFVRDFSQSWYQDGLPLVSEDIYCTAKHIKSIVDRIKPKKVYFVGNSMGGYAAIMFCSLMGVGEAIAFSPQTFISPFLRFIHRDHRWSKQIKDTYKKSLFKPKIWNLRKLLLRSTQDRKISIFVSTEDKLDHIHALYLSKINGVEIYEFGSGGHGVVKFLRDQGKLQAIMAGTYDHHCTN